MTLKVDFQLKFVAVQMAASRASSVATASFVLCMYVRRVDFGEYFVLSLSFSFPVRGAGHCPNPFQVAPEASWVGSEGVSWPDVPPGVIVGWTLEHQMLDRLVGAVRSV